MTQSTIQPKTIEIDTIKNGKVEILAHWDIKQIEVERMDGEPELMWQYKEVRMEWVLPEPFNSMVEIESYFETVKDEIIKWAQAAKVTM